MRLPGKKCTFLLDILGLVLLFIVSCSVVYQFLRKDALPPNSFITADDLIMDLRIYHEQVAQEGVKVAARSVLEEPAAGTESAGARARGYGASREPCTMHTCFDVSRCRTFRVYVYPNVEGLKVSPLYEKILRVIRNSHYYTRDPSDACLFVPSVDALDRDKASTDFTPNLPDLGQLEYWNNGTNHLIFNQYSGTWPKYRESLDFHMGKAILAKASFNVSHFRPGFDISLPLMHKDHLERGGNPGVLSTNGNLLPVRRKYILAFKGKRYLYGAGKESRSPLYHIHNGRDIVMITTCKHNRDWHKYQDERCGQDNQLYDSYDYADLLENSSFCLVPRGRRLGSFRFLESLQASCIPISMSNGYVLPFSEVIDWDKASLTIDERQLLQVPHLVRSVPTHQLLSMRSHTQFLWETYFNSLERIVSTTLEIIRNRMQPRSSFVWNRPPGALAFYPEYSPHLLDYPFYDPIRVSQLSGRSYTVVIACNKPALRGSSPLIKLIRNIASAPHLSKIVILWSGSGPPRINLPSFNVPVVIRPRNLHLHLTSRFWPLNDVETDAILHLNEEVNLTVDEAEFGFATWLSFPDRLVGYVAHKHYWDPVHKQWGYTVRWTNEFSLVLTGAVFCHRYYGFLLTKFLPPVVQDLADKNPYCLDIAVNFLVTQVTKKAPIKVTQKKELFTSSQESTVILQRRSSDRIACLNMIVNAYGYVPLVYSAVRMDPILFKDNVSMLRKEYRRLEVL